MDKKESTGKKPKKRVAKDDLLGDLDWQDIREEGFPKPYQKVVLNCVGIYTAHHEPNKKDPLKGNWVVDKQKILDVMEWAAIDNERLEAIKKKYWLEDKQLMVGDGK